MGTGVKLRVPTYALLQLVALRPAQYRLDRR